MTTRSRLHPRPVARRIGARHPFAGPPVRAALTLVLSSVLLATPALADESFLSRVTAGLETVGAVSLTDARTQGGIGGGVHVAFALDSHWQVYARAAWLWGLGSHTLIRAGAGWQREGTWRPLFHAGLALGLGGALEFGLPGRAPPSRAPTLGVVVGAALLRFQVESVIVSALELEAGLSTEFVSFGPRAGVTVLSLSVPLGP